MSRKQAILWMILLGLIGLVLCSALLLNGYLITAMLLFLVWGGSVIIFFSRRAYPYRFMYPGLVTFLIFMIFPMAFTIYIGFTNLSTGHVLSLKDVHKILVNEMYIPDNAAPVEFKLTKKRSNYTLWLDHPEHGLLSTTFNDETVPKLLRMEKADVQLGTPLKRGEVFQIREFLKEWTFNLPDGTPLKYFRSDKLARLVKRYSSTSPDDFRLIDQQSGHVYYPDREKGLFTNGQEYLAPGFYVEVGFKNFLSLFKDDRIKGPFFKVFVWTMVWAFMSVFLSFVVGMFLALIVNSGKLKGRPIYRMMLIIPYSIPFFISVLIFKGLLNKDFGIINEIITGMGFAKVPWLDDPFWAKISCLMVNLWLGFPYMFLIITGILQSIPASVYEAAKLDGAGRWATFKRITLPLIMVAVAPLLVGSFAFNLNNFVGIYLLTGGQPPMQGAVTPVGETDILISYTYRLAFEGGRGQDFGLASSISILIFLIISILTLINFKLSGMMKEERR